MTTVTNRKKLAQSRNGFSVENLPLSIPRDLLSKKGWKRVIEACEYHGISKFQLEATYKNFEQTMEAREHPDTTPKTRNLASMDALRFQFSAGIGELAAEMLIRTYFVLPWKSLKLPLVKEKRTLDFSRLFVLGCTFASKGIVEAIAEYWACVCGREGLKEEPGLSLLVNIDFVRTVLECMFHEIKRPLKMMIEELVRRGEQECTKNGYITLGFIVRFCALHPILAMPISVCQKAIQRRMGGFSFWNADELASGEQEVALKLKLSILHSFSPAITIRNYQNAWVSSAMQIIAYAYHEAYSRADNDLEFLDGCGQYLNQKFRGGNVTERIVHKSQNRHHKWWRRRKIEQYHHAEQNKSFHCILCRNVASSEVFCQGCAVKGKRAAYNRWGMKAVMDMLRTHSSGQLLGFLEGGSLLPHSIVSDNRGVMRGVEWEEMLDTKYRKTFFNSVLCGASIWSEECKCSPWGKENYMTPVVSAKLRSKHENKVYHHPKYVFPCNEDDSGFVVQSHSSIRHIDDAHLHLINRHRLIYADANIN